MDKALIIGIGNYGRSDDALGWSFVDGLSEYHGELDFEYRYQLQIEDADLITRYGTVYFADASFEDYDRGYIFTPCKPGYNSTITSHALTAQTILQMAKDLYGKTCNGYIIGISGYKWDLKEGICEKAAANLIKALEFFKNHIDHIYTESYSRKTINTL